MKKMLVVFQDNKDILSHTSKESVLHSLISGMTDSGKTVTDFSVPNLSDRVVSFDDGSEIHVKPISNVGRTEKYTHIYIDKSLSECFPTNRFETLLVEDSHTYSINGSRLNNYQIKDGDLFINKM